MRWATSDTHWWHRNVIDYCDRPFRTLDGHPDVELMNDTMIHGWNNCVDPTDTVFHMGDVSWGSSEKIEEVVRQLNGHKVLILGNHDKKTKTFYRRIGFEEVTDRLELEGALLIHSPYQAKDQLLDRPPFSLTIHGHVHCKWRTRIAGRAVFTNVGVDVWDFRPVSLDRLFFTGGMI